MSRCICSRVIGFSANRRAFSSVDPICAATTRYSLPCSTRLMAALRKPVQALSEAMICCNTSLRPSSARNTLPRRITSLICCARCGTSIPCGYVTAGDRSIRSSGVSGILGMVGVLAAACSCSHCVRSAVERKRTRKGTYKFCCFRSDITFLIFLTCGVNTRFEHSI